MRPDLFQVLVLSRYLIWGMFKRLWRIVNTFYTASAGREPRASSSTDQLIALPCCNATKRRTASFFATIDWLAAGAGFFWLLIMFSLSFGP
jgi:hypothetical protein